MGDAKRDANSIPTLIGVSNADGTTPVTLYVDPATHRLLVSGAGGSTTFIGLTDVPASFTGAALKVVRVNAGETALEFVTLAGGGDALTTDPLSQFAATTSLQLKGVISDETGSGALVFATSPVLVTPNLGTPSAAVLTNATGLVSFIAANEATDTTCFPLFVTAATGELGPKTNAGLTFNSNTGILTATGFSGPLTGNVTGNTSGSSGSTTGNAATATALQTARTIGGVSFDGTANITVSSATGGFAVSGGDLDIASGGVIDFNAGDVTITHSANTLTFAGGTIVLGTATATGGLTANVTGNLTGNADTVTTNANLTGAVTSVGNATTINHLRNAQTGTTYTIVTGDRSKYVTFNNALAVAVTLPVAGGTFPDGWYTFVQNIGVGTVTITPTTSTINGSATLILTTNQSAIVVSDGTNYSAFIGQSSGSGGASTALDNLASVAINTTLVSDTNNTDDLGTSSIAWRTLYAGTSIELGHASDTTITRASAGAINVESIPVLLAGSTTVGQIPRITGSNTYAWGALNLADTDAVTGLLPIANLAAFTKTINMMQHVTVDTTGDAFFEPYQILATNDLFGQLILRCGANNAAAPTVKAGMYGVIHIPEDYNTGGTVTCEVYWTTTLTANDVVFDLDYRAIGGDDTESLDQASYQESLTVTDTAPSAANERQKATMTFTASNLAAGDTLEFFFGRDGAAGGDTLAGSAIVHEVIFKYTT